MNTHEFDRLVEQYMLMDKKTLAELLAFRELINRQDFPTMPTYPWPNWPSTPSAPWPWCPTPGDTPWWPQIWWTTKTSNGNEYENFTPFTANTDVQACKFNRNDCVEDTVTRMNMSDGPRDLS